jgi:hypothetical protein
MSQIQFTEEERSQALQRFGYLEGEARFLCTAALHSGYFLRRQCAAFLNKSGGSVAALIEKIFDNGHASAVAYDRHTHLYHLCARPFYAAIGQEDNRNRRARECSTVKNKLMALDFVLAHPDMRFLATEQEKLLYFTSSLGIPRCRLPARTYGSVNADPTQRYFVEKYPIFLPRDDGHMDTVSFCFIDEGLVTPSHFETFLQHYGRLFSELSTFHLTYVAARPTPFRWVETVFQKHLKAWLGAAIPNDSIVKRLTRYFALRRQYDVKDFERLDRNKLLDLRKAQIEFSHPQYAELYEVWKAGGDMAVRQILSPKSDSRPTPKISFSNCLLEHNYDFFGSLTAI